MTLITGTIKDSANYLLSGKLEIKANYIITDSSTTPTSVITTQPREFTITNGNINFNLVETDIDKISYRFTFKVLEENIDGINEYVELFSFDAIVPNLPEIDFADLLPTDYSVDQLNTGRYSIARIIATNPQFSEAIKFRFNYRGAYNNTTLYTRDDVVAYDGCTYIYINPRNTFGNLPPDYGAISNTYWTTLSKRGVTGTGTAGNNTVYGSTWINSTDAPTRNSVYNIIETLAPTASPILTGNPTAPTQFINNSSTSIATTAFVNDTINTDYLRYNLSSNQVIAENNLTAIIFDEASTANPNYNVTTGEFTIPFTGIYLLNTSFNIEALGSTLTSCFGSFQNNRADGLIRISRFYSHPSNSMTSSMSVNGTVFLPLTAGDKITVRGQASSLSGTAQLRFVWGSTTTRLTVFNAICLRRLA